MNIYNLFFDKEDKEKFPSAGWHMSDSLKGIKLSANVGGLIKTVVSSSEELIASCEEGLVNKRTLCIKPCYKSAKLALPTESLSLNFAVYIKVAVGQKISSIKLEGCSVVMSSIDNVNREEAAMLVIVQDPDNYKVVIYQTDKRVISIQNGKLRLSSVTHVLNMSKKINPKLYLELPVKAYITSDLKSKIAIQMKEEGYEILYAPLLLISNKYLYTGKVISGDMLNADNDYVIDKLDKIKYGEALADALREVYKYLNICYVSEETSDITHIFNKPILTYGISSVYEHANIKGSYTTDDVPNEGDMLNCAGLMSVGTFGTAVAFGAGKSVNVPDDIRFCVDVPDFDILKKMSTNKDDSVFVMDSLASIMHADGEANSDLATHTSVDSKHHIFEGAFVGNPIDGNVGGCTDSQLLHDAFETEENIYTPRHLVDYSNGTPNMEKPTPCNTKNGSMFPGGDKLEHPIEKVIKFTAEDFNLSHKKCVEVLMNNEAEVHFIHKRK